ncbi:MAG: hypothetical protein MRY83_22660 [Flavobacteriales bacterium]|nr:hypothetical protein [Flavobacteriales bacterium]
MGLFKKIFGQTRPGEEKEMEKAVEGIESGEYNKIYPILKPGDWVGIKAGALKQTLFGSQEDPHLVLGFGYDTPTNFVFLMPRDIEGKDPNAVLNEAYDNLEAFESEFEVPPADSNTAGILTASGKDFCSEKILCKSHMDKAHSILGADELLVSIPRRTCMMVIARNADDDTMNKFAYLHNYTWEDDSYGNAPIMNALFVVKDGQIDGLIPMDK